MIGECCVSCFSTSLAADDGQIQLRPLQPINTKGAPPSSPIKAGAAVSSVAASRASPKQLRRQGSCYGELWRPLSGGLIGIKRVLLRPNADVVRRCPG